MSDLATFRELWSSMDPALKEWCNEAKELRHPVEDANVQDTLSTLHEQLVASRRAQDRMEGILADVGRVRSRTRKLVSELQDEYDDQWRAAMNANRTGEYLSKEAQNATYSLGAIDQQVNLRRGQRMLADVEETYDYVYLKHRGLENQIRDFKDRMRAVNFEANYERG